MKKVLITGANSYIGTNVEQWLLKEPDKYHVETLDMKDPNWINFDFSKFDVVFHVAGIAHIKETKKNRDLYYKINRDLAFETAKKAKESRVKQFIYMSSMSIFGKLTGKICKETLPKPNTYYGKSKYQAEILLKDIESDRFIITVIRPPMVYGENSPGNYNKLRILSKYTRIVPKINNKRSVISIEELNKTIEKYIDNNQRGIFHPQNKNYLVTNNELKKFRKQIGKKTAESYFLMLIVRLLILISRTFKKLYGSLYYEMNE